MHGHSYAHLTLRLVTFPLLLTTLLGGFQTPQQREITRICVGWERKPQRQINADLKRYAEVEVLRRKHIHAAITKF